MKAPKRPISNEDDPNVCNICGRILTSSEHSVTNGKHCRRHKLKSDWVKALARAKLLVDAGKTGTVYSNGLGHGSASIRAALRNRGLIDNDDVITEAGIAAVVRARQEGW